MRKSILFVCGLCVAFAACDDIQNGITPIVPPKEDVLPSITSLSSDVIVLYPYECSCADSIDVAVSDADELIASSQNGVDAIVKKIDADCYRIILSASEHMGDEATLSVKATNTVGETSRTVSVAKAYVSLERDEFSTSDAGATIFVIPESNVGVIAEVEGPESSWIHCSPASSGYSVKIDRNAGFEPRSGRVRVSDSMGLINRYLSITQDAATDWSRLEREALVALYEATDGKNWKLLSNTTGGRMYSTDNWCTDAPVDSWYGVTLNSEGHVMYLHLSGVGLKGTLPEEIGDMVFLQELWLSGNELSGPLPASLGKLSVLKDIDISGMGLTGELEDCALKDVAPHLKNLSLAGNLFSGGYPSWVGDMPENSNFWLQGNCLEGKVPDKVKAHPRWNAEVLDGSGRTLGQINMEQREGYVLQ